MSKETTGVTKEAKLGSTNDPEREHNKLGLSCAKLSKASASSH